ncbi:Nucleic acid-binding, OB-fold [Sesbania bispinosa]|nr:Nucleic acid-binding, OB-fold [Sesbania bispinosa]
MGAVFDPVKNVYPGKQTWHFKVRVELLWEMFPLDEPAKPFSIEMVLLDVEGWKIQASIRKPMIKKFKELVVEGEVYKMHFFRVVRNLGSYRATRHEYKFLFHAKTKITRCESLNVPHLGVVPVNSQMILETGGQSDYLMDFIGVLVAVSTEKRSVRDGQTTRVVQMELLDDNIISKGIDMGVPLGVIEDHNVSASPVEEFLHMYPRKTISELHDTEEDLGGREFLFKVEKADDFAFKYDDTFKVKRSKFFVPFPSLEDIPEDTTQNNIVDPAPNQDGDHEGSAFCVADFLSEQAGCPIGAGSEDAAESSCNGVGKGREKGKMVGA